uniref:RIIB n=1 Tax=Vibrio phage P018-4 TaxID=3229728 RepID=A0AB39AJE5_9CAUD
MSRTNIVKILNEGQKLDIYTNYLEGNHKTKKALAKDYGISTRTLGRIIKEMESIPEPEIKNFEYDYTVTKNQITIFCNDESRSVDKGYPKFKSLRKKLIEEDFCDTVLKEVYDLLNLPKFVETFSEGNITVKYETGQVFYGTFEIKNSLTDHLMVKLGEGEDVLSFVRFMDKLLSNTKPDIVEELYGFMKHYGMEIHEDGDIIAYKGVRENYNDCWTNTISNKIGQKPRMPASEVVHDPKRPCGAGLHAGSMSYAKGWSRGHVMKVKINPVDVCSVPWDCDSQKMRTCGYEVLDEV